jgi:hypothetical protein
MHAQHRGVDLLLLAACDSEAVNIATKGLGNAQIDAGGAAEDQGIWSVG